MATVGDQISDLIDQEKWSVARDLIQKELKKKPNDHWLLDRLSLTYYEERNYQQAMSIIEKAYQEASDCPMVLWDYAGTLDALGRSEEAIEHFSRIIENGVAGLAKEECSEGEEWAKSLYADTIYRIGVCYQHLQKKQKARQYFQHYLSLRADHGGTYQLTKKQKDIVGQRMVSG
jgi:tetratricopeptide (TPR) repeat protein